MQPARWVDVERGVCAMRLAGCLPPELQDHAAEEEMREREEADRVLYVAATRARDLLVVPAVGDAPFESWLDGLHPALYPPIDRAAVPLTATPPGCPALRGESVLERPGAMRPEGAVTPGLHAPASGQHQVVWWAPQALGLDLEENLGLRQQKLLQVDEGGARSGEGVRRHDAWQRTRGALRASGAEPRLVVATATERAGAAADFDDEIAVEAVPAAAHRPHGPRFGTLVHAVLATIDLDAAPDDVARLSEIEGRILGASSEEVAAAAVAVSAALAHPLLRRAAATACRRETPVAIRLDDGVVVEGVIDAAFAEGGGWTVVDFKTDVELAPRLEEYRAQVRLYVRTVAAATGKPARGVLLRV
jgi:ATP-dependent exoDNAse (exonuclease V) beta subunit